jgi:hypothetical protein
MSPDDDDDDDFELGSSPRSACATPRSPTRGKVTTSATTTVARTVHFRKGASGDMRA